MNIIVSIVSAQTLPNYLFIKEFQNQADLFLFISTAEMKKENKTKLIYETAGLEKKQIRKILIHEDELYLAKKRLDGLNWDNADYSFLVNITGGTKLMSYAVFEYYKKLNSRFFYLPIGKNFIKEIFDNKPALTLPIHYNVSVDEYLNLYGISPKEEPLKLNENSVTAIFNHYKKRIPEKWPFSNLSRENISEQQKIALWFEHFLYFQIKKHLDLPDNSIKLGVKLFKKENDQNYRDHLNDNEIDIIFTKNNTCYIVEAKVSVGKNKINTSAITNYLYKLAAINKRFGINAKAVLMLYTDLSSLSATSKQNLKNRCNVLNLPFPFSRKEIDQENLFKDKLLTLTNTK